MSFEEVKLCVDYDVRNLCVTPYPNHRKGCPNYNKRPSCPPAAKRIENILNLDLTTYVIWTTFDFGGHVKRMQTNHPNWSQRQAECCYYWQGTARKNLKQEIGKFQMIYKEPEFIIIQCPEACGVNVTATMAKLNECLEWPPKTTTYQVAVAGFLKGGE